MLAINMKHMLHNILGYIDTKSKPYFHELVSLKLSIFCDDLCLFNICYWYRIPVKQNWTLILNIFLGEISNHFLPSKSKYLINYSVFCSLPPAVLDRIFLLPIPGWDIVLGFDCRKREFLAKKNTFFFWNRQPENGGLVITSQFYYHCNKYFFKSSLKTFV